MPTKESILVCPEDLDQDRFIEWINGIAKGDRLTLTYCPIDLIPYWEENFKKHDIGSIWQSIARYGFRDPFAWDKHLNGGDGGIVEGNGRREALEHGFKAKQPAPRGILVKGDRWYAPLLIGVDSAGEKEAIAYGMDHNSLTLLGGEFTALDVSKLFEEDAYLEALTNLANFDMLPVSVDGDDLDFLLNYKGTELTGISEIPEDNKDIDEDALAETNCECPNCGFKWKK